jgi:hypothetical protein
MSTYDLGAARAARHERLLADIADAVWLPSPSGYGDSRISAARDLLSAAGYHPGQVDADGHLVTAPHGDGCRQCAGAAS